MNSYIDDDELNLENDNLEKILEDDPDEEESEDEDDPQDLYLGGE